MGTLRYTSRNHVVAVAIAAVAIAVGSTVLASVATEDAQRPGLRQDPTIFNHPQQDSLQQDSITRLKTTEALKAPKPENGLAGDMVAVRGTQPLASLPHSYCSYPAPFLLVRTFYRADLFSHGTPFQRSFPESYPLEVEALFLESTGSRPVGIGTTPLTTSL